MPQPANTTIDQRVMLCERKLIEIGNPLEVGKMYVTSEVVGSDIFCKEYLLDEELSTRWFSRQAQVHNLTDLNDAVRAAHEYDNGCLVIPFITNKKVADIQSGKNQLAYQVILSENQARELRVK